MTEEMALKDVCSHIVDCVNRTAPEDLAGDYFAIGTPAMRGNTIDLSEARRLSKETFDRWTRRLVPRDGDLLLAREAPVGPVIRFPSGGRFAAGQRTTHLRAEPSIVEPRFLYYLLISPEVQSRVSARAMGSTVPHLRVADVKSLLLPVLPNLSEQKRISDVLGALDDKIAANRQVIAASLELSAAAVSAVQWPTRPVPLGDITTSLVRGAAPNYSDTGYVVLNQKCVRNGLVDVTLARNSSTLPTVATKVLRQNDVLVNSTGQGTLGRTSRWIRADAEVTTDSHISIVRFDSTLVDDVFAGTVLAGMERDIESLAEGSTGQTELRRDLLATLELRLPDIETQRRIGGSLSAMSDAVNARQDENHVLARTRDELLPLLMNGKITVKQAEARAEKVL